MPDPNAYSQAPEEGGNAVTDALNKQLGPLKAWQWGVAVGGAVLLYFLIHGRSSGSSTTTTVPFTSDTSGNVASDLGSISNPMHTIVDQLPGGPTDGGGGVIDPGGFVKKLLYTRARVIGRANIYDKAGHVIGHMAAGRTLLLGAKVKINGKWFYPIINMPGKYVNGGKTFSLTPVYDNVPSAATGPISNAIAAPATTLSASAANLYQPATGTDSIAPPSANNGYQLSASQLQLPTATH